MRPLKLLKTGLADQALDFPAKDFLAVLRFVELKVMPPVMWSIVFAIRRAAAISITRRQDLVFSMIISRLVLKNWRNFRVIDVPLTERVFVIGPNASGKSNLLDALRFLRDIAKPGGGLQRAITQRGGISKVRCLAARKEPDIEVAVELSENGSGVTWKYTIGITQQIPARTTDPSVNAAPLLQADRGTASDPDCAGRVTRGQQRIPPVLKNRTFGGTCSSDPSEPLHRLARISCPQLLASEPQGSFR